MTEDKSKKWGIFTIKDGGFDYSGDWDFQDVADYYNLLAKSGIKATVDEEAFNGSKSFYHADSCDYDYLKNKLDEYFDENDEMYGYIIANIYCKAMSYGEMNLPIKFWEKEEEKSREYYDLSMRFLDEIDRDCWFITGIHPPEIENKSDEQAFEFAKKQMRDISGQTACRIE